MKKILFPTEFSEQAPEVFKYAAELAYFFKARLVTMYAYGKPEFQLANNETAEHMADISSDSLMALVQENLPEQYREHISVDYVTKLGFASEAILQVALEEEIDLIVMGMTGKTNALDTIFGTTSREVLAKSDCPVLAIPVGAKFEGIDNIAYTTNFEFRDLQAINYLKKWSKVFRAPVHCLHILDQKENASQHLRNMKILSDTFQGEKSILFDIRKGDFREDIEGFAKSKSADILAMMSHKRNFIARLMETSAVKGVARRTHIPLLVIKDNAYELNSDIESWMQFINSIA